MDAIDDLIKLLSRLPGIGGKSAARMTYRLIGTDPNYNKDSARLSLHYKIRFTDAQYVVPLQKQIHALSAKMKEGTEA